jgi:hypothetical protein
VPTGLHYKLRVAIGRKIVEKQIKVKFAQLECDLAKLCVDEWQATYGGEVASSVPTDNGSVEAPIPNATMACKVDLVGQEGSPRDAHTPRFVIGALMSKYPELFNDVVSDMGLVRAA